MPENPNAPIANTASVSSKVLLEFVEVVASDNDLPGISERLKIALIDKRSFSEATLRQALFGDAE